MKLKRFHRHQMEERVWEVEMPPGTPMDLSLMNVTYEGRACVICRKQEHPTITFDQYESRAKLP